MFPPTLFRTDIPRIQDKLIQKNLLSLRDPVRFNLYLAASFLEH